MVFDIGRDKGITACCNYSRQITAAAAASGDAAVVSGLKAMKVIIAGLEEE